MNNWNVYRDESCHGPMAIRVEGLVAEPTGDGWFAVYRREKGRYPNTIIGLRQKPITAEELNAVGARHSGEDRELYDQRLRADLQLTHYDDVALPRPAECVQSPFVNPNPCG